MNRLQKKCFLVSAATHGLLAAFLLFGLGFLKHPNQIDKLPILELVPDTLIDAALYGGGGPPAPAAASKPSPSAAATTATSKPAPQAESKPEPTPPKTASRPVVRDPVVSKPPPKNSKPPKPDPEPDQDDTPPEKTTTATKPSATSKIKVDTSKIATRTRPDKSTTKPKSNETSNADAEAAEAAATAKAAADRRATIGRGLANATQSLGSGLSTTTTIEMPGLGGGGPMYANWAQVVKSIYDHSWRQPEELADESATVEVDILVLKDGSVQMSGTHISRKSGIPSLDKSVQQVLDRVRNLPPFPEGATDAQRKLRIAFKLKQNRSAG